MALWVQVDGTETEVVLSKESSMIKMSEMQNYVGGYSTPIYLSNGKIMLVNEEGILRKLPYNDKATRLATSLSNHRNTVPSAINTLETLRILGNALILSKVEFK